MDLQVRDVLGPRLGFPKVRATFGGIPKVRMIIFWGPYWGPSISGNDQMGYSLYSLKEVLQGSIRGAVKGDTRSLDCSSCRDR